MQTGKYGWKFTSLILIIIATFCAILTGMQYGRLSVRAAQTVVRTDNPQPTMMSLDATNKSSQIWQTVQIHPGDTLSRIFKKLNIKPADLVYLTQHAPAITRLHPGKMLEIQVNADRSLQRLRYPLNLAKSLVLERQGKHFVTKIGHQPTTTVLSFKSAVVHHSLHQAVIQAGITAGLLSQLQTIFNHSVNFAHDIHRGDRLAFLYQTYYIHGKKYHDGNIVAAELTHRGKTYRAIRYRYPQAHQAHSGYFTPEGQGLGTRFLHAPLHYARISSLFNLHRFDPILHRIRPHLGIDYAAENGTPIHSIGDGRIIFMGREGGFGKIIKIRYDQHEVALYAHLWRFAHVQLHQLIHKGAVIGYVGHSGWATGPHLHFGFYVDGTARNWLAMRALSGPSIPSHYRKQFLAISRQLLAQLHWYQDVQLAMNNANH